MINLKNLSKDFNRERASRKQEFKKEFMVQKLDLEKQRYDSMVEERE